MRLSFILFFIFAMILKTTIYCQDKIVFTSGKIRECIVLFEDSSFVNVILRSNGKDMQTAIDRKYIQSIIYDTKNKQRDKIVLNNGDTIHCEILNEDSISYTVKYFENKLEKTLFISKNTIRAISRQNITDPGVKLGGINTFVSINVGGSIPLGDFGASGNLNSGDASMGSILAMQLSLEIMPHIFFGIKGYGLVNSINILAASQYYYSTEDSRNIVNSKYWKVFGVLAGFEFSIPTEQVDFRCRALGGLNFVKTPDAIIKTPNSTFVYHKTSSSALGYNLGISFDTKFSSRFYLILDLDYLHADFSFEDFKTTKSIKTDQTLIVNNGDFQFPTSIVIKDNYKTSISMRQVFKVFTIGFGIRYNFNLAKD